MKITIRDRNDVRNIPVGTKIEVVSHWRPDYVGRIGTVCERPWQYVDLCLQVSPDTRIEFDIGSIGSVLGVSDGSFWLTNPTRDRALLRFVDEALRDVMPSTPGVGEYYERKHREAAAANAALEAAHLRGAPPHEIAQLKRAAYLAAYCGD